MNDPERYNSPPDCSPYDPSHWHRRFAGEPIEDLICEVVFRWAIGPGRGAPAPSPLEDIRAAALRFEQSVPTQNVDIYGETWPIICGDLAGVLDDLARQLRVVPPGR